MTDLTRHQSRTTAAVEPELALHTRFLHDRYGDHWADLPTGLGQALVKAEVLLTSGPVAIPPTIPAPRAIVRARRAARAATAMSKTACNEAEVLEHALGSSLVDLSLARLSAVVDAVIGLSAAPRPEPAWASPVAAHAADALLDACHDDLRESAQLHQAVYAQFSDHIWFVPVRRLRNGRHWWRPIARLRLHHALAVSSRTHKAPSSVSGAADLILEAHVVRNRLFATAALLATHLGEHDRGPVTDIDAARESLTAVRDLQRALGDRLNPERIQRLLAADAFNSDAVLEPATILGTALQAWAASVDSLGGTRAVAMDCYELAQWAVEVEAALPALEAAVTAADEAHGPTSTLRDLVYDLLVRERCDKLTDRASSPAIATSDAGTAS